MLVGNGFEVPAGNSSEGASKKKKIQRLLAGNGSEGARGNGSEGASRKRLEDASSKC